MAEYAESKGVPHSPAAVAVSGLMILLGGLSMILGVYPVVGAILLVLFLVPVSLYMHNFWMIPDEQMRMVEAVNFTRNMALLGAALMVMAHPTPWPASARL